MQALPTQEPQQSKPRFIPKKPLSQRIGGFVNRQKYAIVSFIIVISVIGIELLNINIDSGFSLSSITLPLILLAFATYCAYWVMTDAGKDTGIKSAVYVEATKRYTETREMMKETGYKNKLKEFCAEKRRVCLEEVRRDLLLDSTISYEEYLEMYTGKDKHELEELGLCKQDIEIIRKADKYKVPKLTASALWNVGAFDEQVAFVSRSGSRKLAIKKVKKALRIVAMALVTVSISTAGMIVWDWQVLYQLACVIINMYLGYRDGYDSYAVIEAQRYISKAELLEECAEWVKAQPAPQKTA